MLECLRDSYDVVVASTGATESMLAAALARSGLSVLHVDESSVYGRRERTTRASVGASKVDVDPEVKLIYSRGALVDVLVESGAARYVDFRRVDALRVVDARRGDVVVPTSKALLFKSKAFSPREKRQLMRFLQQCREETLTKDFGAMKNELSNLDKGRALPRPQNLVVSSGAFANVEFFEDLLARELGSEYVRDVVRYGVCGLPNADPTRTLKIGLERMRDSMHALGRFGDTPYLVPTYGCGEIAQAFCRSAAVDGATYVLNAKVGASETAGSVALTFEGETREVRVNKCIVAPRDVLESSCVACVLSKPLHKSEERTVLLIPPGNVDDNPRVLSACARVAANGEPILVAPSSNVVDFILNAANRDNDEQEIRVVESVELTETFDAGFVFGDDVETIFVETNVDPTFDANVYEAKRIFALIVGEQKEFLPASAQERKRNEKEEAEEFDAL